MQILGVGGQGKHIGSSEGALAPGGGRACIASDKRLPGSPAALGIAFGGRGAGARLDQQLGAVEHICAPLSASRIDGKARLKGGRDEAAKRLIIGKAKFAAGIVGDQEPADAACLPIGDGREGEFTDAGLRSLLLGASGRGGEQRKRNSQRDQKDAGDVARPGCKQSRHPSHTFPPCALLERKALARRIDWTQPPPRSAHRPAGGRSDRRGAH